MNILQNIIETPAVLVSLLAATISAFTSGFLALWARRTQRYLALQQSDLQKDLERHVNEFKDSLERRRMMASSTRDRIIQYVDRVLASYIEISALSRHVRRVTWTDSQKYLEGDTQFGVALHLMKANFNVLEAFQVVPEELSSLFRSKVTAVESGWASAYGEMYFDTSEFRNKYPDCIKFSAERFKNKVEFLESAVNSLGGIICSIPAKISLPE